MGKLSNEVRVELIKELQIDGVSLWRDLVVERQAIVGEGLVGLLRALQPIAWLWRLKRSK